MLYAVTPYGRNTGSSRVRVYQWLDRIAEPSRTIGYIGARNGSPKTLAVNARRVIGAERALRRRADARPARLLLHREASPLSRGALERRLMTKAEFGVYDFDDALHTDTGAGSWWRRVAPKAAKTLAAVRAADRVIAGNQVLADWASQHNDDVVIIPSCVAVDSYRAKHDYELSDPPRIGWIGDADNEAYLPVLAPALHELHRRTGARLTLIGATDPKLGELEPMIDRIAWSEQVQHEELARLDIGIGPVPDAPYERGKCGYKLLQYGAAGLPVVASPVGVNRTILQKFAMPAVEPGGDWLDPLLGLLDSSADERARLGRAIRATTESDYSYDAWLPRWRAAVGVAR